MCMRVQIKYLGMSINRNMLGGKHAWLEYTHMHKEAYTNAHKRTGVELQILARHEMEEKHDWSHAEYTQNTHIARCRYYWPWKKSIIPAEPGLVRVEVQTPKACIPRVSVCVCMCGYMYMDIHYICSYACRQAARVCVCNVSYMIAQVIGVFM